MIAAPAAGSRVIRNNRKVAGCGNHRCSSRMAAPAVSVQGIVAGQDNCIPAQAAHVVVSQPVAGFAGYWPGCPLPVIVKVCRQQAGLPVPQPVYTVQPVPVRPLIRVVRHRHPVHAGQYSQPGRDQVVVAPIQLPSPPCMYIQAPGQLRQQTRVALLIPASVSKSRNRQVCSYTSLATPVIIPSILRAPCIKA